MGKQAWTEFNIEKFSFNAPIIREAINGKFKSSLTPNIRIRGEPSVPDDLLREASGEIFGGC